MADAGLSAPGLLPLEEQYALLLAFDWVYAQLLHIGSGARATLTLEAFVLSFVVGYIVPDSRWLVMAILYGCSLMARLVTDRNIKTAKLAYNGDVPWDKWVSKPSGSDRGWWLGRCQ
jgi:hypothetical protein